MVEPKCHSGGLALLWKNGGGCRIKRSGTHFIDFEVENEQIRRWDTRGDQKTAQTT